MDDQENEHDSMERILNDTSADPIMLSYAFLKNITNNFSKMIGSGGFGVVYLGVLRNRKIAVKKLSRIDDFSEKQFEDELLCLIRVKHKNIVRFLGYCSDTSKKVVWHNGKHIIADIRQRFLCFEYARNKSLHDYLKDNAHRCEWDTRYQLIEGICEGLRYLHNEEHINHLDLKPENILLDADMVPKITDFGLSRRFSGTQSRIITKNKHGSPGYMAPEYWINGEISFKSDIFSLGVIIIKLLRENNDSSTFGNWHAAHNDLPQVRKCLEIAQLCVNEDQHKRPSIDYVIDMLNGTETMIQKTSAVLSQARKNSGSSIESVDYESMPFLEIDPKMVHTSELFRDDMIKLGSNATSNVGGSSMDNPQTGPVDPQSQGTVYNLKLYMHQTIGGPSHNHVNIANLEHPQMFGYTNVHDYPIYDSLGPSANVVARAQGLHTETSLNYDDWFHWSSIVFSDESFQGSSLITTGNQNKIDGEWVIVGGTGVFTFAQGTITICRILESGSSDLKEICIRAFGCTGQSTQKEAKALKNNMINIDSNATSNVCSPSMANPHSATLTPQSQGTQYIRIFYMHQIISGPNFNQVNIADPKQPQMFGYTNVHDYPIYDSLGPGKKVVARAQGLHTKTSMNGDGWFHWSKVAFDYERFHGSSFNAIGNQEGEWAIVGGTGAFTFAKGVVATCRVQDTGSSNIKEIRIRALCCEPTIPVEIKPFKDMTININSNASSNVCNPSMANPQSGRVTGLSHRNEYSLILYMHQIISGLNYNQVNIADPKQPQMFGYTNVHDYPIYDSLGPGKKIVARARGLHTKTSMNYNGWFHWSSVVFTDERFQGSSFKAIGNQEGEWAIVGGTGAFTLAQGTITTCRVQESGPSNIKEIRIHALLCGTQNTVPLQPSIDDDINIA